jgi:hypothetical protein
MFALDIPIDLPAATILVAQERSAQASQNDERIIGVCHLATNRPEHQHLAFNSLSPLTSAYLYFLRVEKLEVAHAGGVTLAQGPTQGTVRDEGEGNYRYYAKPDYVGPDSATFRVVIDGRAVELRYSFNVMSGVPGGNEVGDPVDDRRYCPNGWMWRIVVASDDGGTEVA